MANKKIKKKKVDIKKILHITFNSLVVIALISFGVIIYSQQKTIEWIGEFSIKSMSADFVSNVYQSLTIDGAAKKAYVPEVSLRFDYNYLASTTRYQVVFNDSAGTKATINFTEAYQLIDRTYSAERACVDPFVIAINEGLAEGYAEVASKTLRDGRVVVFAASKDDACGGYIAGLSGQDYLNFLKTVDSY